MRTNHSRCADRCHGLAAALALSAALVAPDAGAYGEQGYYTGAYALVGEGGCTGSSMGINPAGGCTPGVDALVHSEAFATGVHGEANHSEAIADLPSSSLVASSIFPDGASNAPDGVANLTDTFTVIGDLPGDTPVAVLMRVASELTEAASTGYGTLSARLAVTGALDEGSAHSFRDRTCAFAGGEPCTTAAGPVWYQLRRLVTVNDANRTFRVDATLAASGSGNPGSHSTDASARVRIGLPLGLAFTSASGVFATVPEPAEIALSSSCVAALGALRRRRARERRAAATRGCSCT